MGNEIDLSELTSEEGQKPGRTTAVEQVTHALRLHALRQDAGEYIGSESTLAAQFGVSRPTFRQAAARLVTEQVIEIRRGAGGGYFARQPASLSVSHMAAIYLHLRDVYFAEIVAVLKPLRVLQVRLAARSTDSDQREELARYIAPDEVWLRHGRPGLSPEEGEEVSDANLTYAGFSAGWPTTRSCS